MKPISHKLAPAVLAMVVAWVFVGLAVPASAGSKKKPELPALSARSVLPAGTQIIADRRGVPTMIRGRLGSIDVSDVARGAESFMNDNLRSALGATGREGFKAVRTQRDDLGQQHVRLRQTVAGLPVYGRDMVLHIDGRSGTVLGVSGKFTADQGARTRPALTARQALGAALSPQRFSGKVQHTRPTLAFIATDDDDLRLAWVSEITYPSKEFGQARDRLFVDAHTGEIIARHPLVYSAKNWKTYDANNGTSLPGTLVLSNNQTTSDSTLQTIHDNTSIVWDYYNGVHGRDSYDDAGATITSSGHYSSNYVNAYWNGSQMVYGDGDGSTSGPLGDALDVVAHELTHAVTENTANLVYQKESGALNEAYSDIMAAAVEAYRDGAVSSDTWLVGEDTWTPGTAGDALRYMDDPAKDGSSADYYPDRNYPDPCSPSRNNDYCGVHTNSGIANLAFYLVVAGGTHPRGKTSVSVPAIGMTKARAIFYRALAVYLTSSSTFEDARNATAQAATDLYGATEADAIHKAWDAVGVPGGSGGGGGTGVVQLTNGVAESNLSDSTGGETFFSLDVPSGASNLSFSISGGSGDADLYVKYGSQPTTSSYDCRPYKNGNNETCSMSSATAGTWYVMLRAYSSYSGVSLVGSYSTSTPNTPPTAAFSFTTADLTATFTNTSSDADGSIVSSSWDFGDGASSSTSNPTHTYSAGGTYTVTLTVTDDAGATDSVSKSVTVTAPSTGGCPAGYTEYSGSLTGSGDSDVQPNGTYYYSGSGTHSGALFGPSGADFDLYLYKWRNGRWRKVKSSTSSTSDETISYNGSSGYYYWSIYSYSGSGSYDFCLSKP